MITVRGRCAAKDGRIHTDTPTKLITVLIYFNDQWEARAAGCGCCARRPISTT